MSYNQPVFTVAAVNSYISNVFFAEEFLHDILVVGEVSGFSIRNDNEYFILKDNDAQLSAVCFTASNTYVPKNGEKVLVRGTVSYYARGGKLSFNVRSIEPDGLGEQFAMLEALKARLQEEGLFSSSRKKTVPTIVKKLCVLTSTSGAVAHDIISTIFKYTCLMDITLVDVSVQGKDAVPSILRVLDRVDKMGFDVLIIARGGGSFEDLSAFNDETLVRAVSKLNTPTISAIGHETDVSLLDLIADERALTPTAAAERVAHSAVDFNSDFSLLCLKLVSIFNLALDNAELELDRMAQRLSASYASKLDFLAAEIDGLAALVKAREPNKLLKAGYVVAENNNGRVASVKEVQEGDILTLYFADGPAKVKVI